MKKKPPHFKNDEEMLEFTGKNDLGDYLEAKDLKKVKFKIRKEFQMKKKCKSKGKKGYK